MHNRGHASVIDLTARVTKLAVEVAQGSRRAVLEAVEKAKIPASSWNTTREVDASEFTGHELFDLHGEYFKYLSRVPVMDDVIVPDLPTSFLSEGLPLAPFVYTDLNSPKDTIRLVKMVSSSQDLWLPICVSTRTVNFRDGAQYATLSYTWSNAHGIFSSEEDAKADTRHDISISCDGKIIKIGENLYRFLCWWRQSLVNFENIRQSMRGKMPDRACPPEEFWIDAICINQKNDEEKNSQVSVMGDIYTHSQTTWIWLGESDVLSEPALELLSTMGNNTIRQSWTRFQKKSIMGFRSSFEGARLARCLIVEVTAGLTWSGLNSWLLDQFRLDPDLAVFFLPSRITSLRIIDTTIESKDTPTLRPVGDSIDPIAMLLELWRLCRTNLCFDARDNVFACASLPNKDIYRTPNTTATRRQLLPGYGRSVTEVYQEAAWFTLLTHAVLQILSMTRPTVYRNIHDLPSWVPDLSQSPRLHGLWQIELEQVKIGWCAAGNSRWKMPRPATLYGRYLMV
ncbi:hypothetical protein EAE99_006175 [Botrytis elliptica]|nr:hypothetical protein EAE99_006175 [Botrytis elliptica]